METLIFKDNFNKILQKSIEFYKNYLNLISTDAFDNIDVVICPNFMNFDYHLKDLKVNIKIFNPDNKSIFEKKLKHVINLIDNDAGKTVICCSESNIASLKESFKKRKIKFVSVDESKYLSKLYSILFR
jgi:hypothetical protein